MPSSLSRRLSKTFRRSSWSSKRSSSSVCDEMSICSDTSTLQSIEFPNPKFQSRIEVIEENDVLDPEDQAWGPPPPLSFQLSWPTFSYKRKPRT